MLKSAETETPNLKEVSWSQEFVSSKLEEVKPILLEKMDPGKWKFNTKDLVTKISQYFLSNLKIN